MAAHCSNDANAAVSLSQKVNRLVAGGSRDYNSWMSLILEIEASCPGDKDTISLAYDSFLSIFPLCHWHLEKYGYHRAKLCGAQEAVKIYEKGAETAMFSVGFWVDYFTFAASCFEDPEDIRRLFVRAVSFVEKDYFCHVLWDKYMKYEYNQEGWGFLALSYIKSLRFPSKKLHFYYDNFKQFVANLEEEIGHETSNNMDVDQISGHGTAATMSKNDISLIIKELLDSSDKFIRSKALDRYIAIGEEFYHEACQMEEKIRCFEKRILRRYFYLTPLDDDQLNNWHLYLNFMERVDDLDWAVKLYERCLIPCANYPEFWMRYVEFLESKGGRELAISALDRAAQVFLKEVADIHQFSARFKEHTGDVNGARTALLQSESKTDSSFIENTMALANLERRLGNLAAACATYEKALETARQKRRLHVLPTLYARFSQLTFLTSGSAAAARDVLIEGVKRLPHCRYLLEELVKFAMTHEGAQHLNIIDPIIADAISPGSDEYEKLNAKDRENMSCLFLEYANLCGNIHDIRKAWNRHIKLFPHYLRIKIPHKPWASGNDLSDWIRAKKGDDESAALDQPSRNQSSGIRLQLQGPEQVLESSANDEIHPNQVLGRLSALENGNSDTKRTVQTVSHKDVVLSKQDGSWNDGPAYGFSRQSREDNLGRIVFSAELTHQPKENAASMYEADQSPPSKATGDNHGQIDGSSEIGSQLNEDALIPHERTEEARKSPETTKSLLPDLGHEFNQQQQRPVSLDSSSHFQGKEPQEPFPPVDKNEIPRVMPGKSTSNSTFNANTDSFPAPKGIQTEHIHNQLEGERPVVSRQSTPTKINAETEEPSSAVNNSLETGNCRAPATGHATSGFREQVPGQESWLRQYFYRDHHTATISAQNVHTNHAAQQNPEHQTHSQMQVGAVQVDKTFDKDQPAGNLMLPTDMPSGQTSGSSQLVSYPIQTTDQNSYQNNQHPWQPQQQNVAMDQMFQYHYQQQQLLQQQYQQQQQQMQQAYIQMQQNYMTPQAYQLQSQQQHVQPTNQLQTQPYQLQQQMPPFQQQPHQLKPSNYQQNSQMVGDLQLQQGKESHLSDQQANEKQNHQNPDLTHQTHQLAYQQYATTYAQQLLLQQYQQQYQAYQHVQHQQQSQEGHNHMQEQQMNQHPVQKQQDELQQQQQVFPSQNLNQNQQGSRKSAPSDNSGASEPSKSPHRSA